MCYIIDIEQRRSRAKEKKMKNKKRFAIVDFYEDVTGETIENCDDYEEAEARARAYKKECDGECMCFIADRETRTIRRI